jgi:hypothetical protein
MNKLKPYKLIEDITLQLVFIKPNDLVTNELVQTKEHEPLPIELEDIQPIEFEPINNHLHMAILKEQMCLFIISTMCLFKTIMQLLVMIIMTHLMRHLLTSTS